MKAISQYFTDALEELNHVTWPTRQQAVRLSVITLIFTAATAVSFGVVDFGLSELVKFLLSFTY